MNRPSRALLGIDLGTTSIKVSVLDADTGAVLGSATSPTENVMPIQTPGPGWAEQDPETWWKHTIEAVRTAAPESVLQRVSGVGIAYQMHGLVLADQANRPIRPAILWCDSRASACGECLGEKLGAEFCRFHLLNSPGNLTAAKLRWVAENEPQCLDAAFSMQLPGDWLATRMGAPPATSKAGLSEMVLWSFAEKRIANEVFAEIGADSELIHHVVSSFESFGEVSAEASATLGIPVGTPISYRAGDQPNNALAVGILTEGSAMANAGTSGVLFSVADQVESGMPTEVNRFLHVNDRVGTLLCLNGVGSAYSWLRGLLGIRYEELNALTSDSPYGESGAFFFPFGNGSERVLGNRDVGAGLADIEFMACDRREIASSVVEGIVFAFRYGKERMSSLNAGFDALRAGRANLFLSPTFGKRLSDGLNTPIELVEADGSVGAARGAGVGLGFWSADEAAAMAKVIGRWDPNPTAQSKIVGRYNRWKQLLESRWLS